MSERLIQQYFDALRVLEQRKDPDPITSMYAQDAEILNANQDPVVGHDEIRKFWRELRAMFSDVSSDFSHVVINGNEAAIEFSTRGSRAATGDPVEFAGVTMLTFRDGKVASDRGYVVEIRR